MKIRMLAVMIVFFASVVLPSNAIGETPKSPAEATSIQDDQSRPVESEVEAAEKESEESRLDDKVTLDFKDADIVSVLRVLSLKSGVNIVAGPEVSGTVTVRLADVPWQKALEVVLRTYGYVYEKDGNIVRVTTREKVASEELMSEAFVLNYITAAEITEAVKEMLTERGRIKAVTRSNTVIVTDVSATIYKISEVIKRLDKPTAQAFIDSRVVRTELVAAENLGIDWNVAANLQGSKRPTTFPFATNTKDQEKLSRTITQFFPLTANSTAPTVNPADLRAFPYDPVGITKTANDFNFGTLDFSQFTAAMKFLKTRKNTKIVSNPRIVVLNNQTAKVQVGDQIPLPKFERNENSGSFEITGYDYRDTGVVLNVTPHINSAEEVLVDLKPEVAASKGTQKFGIDSLELPIFNVTQASTQVLIKSGETIAIGGMLTDNSDTTVNKVPLLGDVPLVGKLFRSKRQDTATAGNNTKVETLFFVTVNVVDTEGQPAGRAAQINNPVTSPVAPAAPATP